jgi:hypothetical protein
VGLGRGTPPKAALADLRRFGPAFSDFHLFSMWQVIDRSP